MIKVNSLTKSFEGFTAVNNLSFEIKPGEVLGFLGPNGAGKSTTMRMLTGFLTPTLGSVEVFGYDLSKAPVELKALIGYLPEGAPLYADMTAYQFLSFIAEMRGLQGTEKLNRIKRMVELLSLQSVLHQTIDTLSKGYKRRVGIAQAIIHDPKVLILDEPTDGLDPNQKHQVRNLIKGLSKDKIVIISTHILEEVEAVCSRAIIISEGSVVADMTPRELRTRSRYHGAITLELKHANGAIESFQNLEGVASVEISGEDNSCFTVFPHENHDLFPKVNGLIQEKGWQIETFFVERGRLDDVFRSFTSTNSKEVA